MMSSRSSVLTQSITAPVPGAHRTTLSSSTTPTQGSGRRDEPQPSQDSDGSVYCDAVQSQHSSDSDAETQPPHPSSAASATTPAATTPDDVWNYSEPVPGSKKKKLIFYKAPFEWGQWTREQWKERFVFIKDKLEALVHEHLRLVDFTNRPVFSPRMVGTSPSEARPAVVVTCRDDDFKNIRNLFRARAEEPLCLGGVPAVSQIRALFGGRAERTVSMIPPLQLVYYRTSTPPVTRHALRKPLAVSLGAGSAACGGIIRYGERSATLGVALDVRGKPRILTVDHLFLSRETNPRPSAFDCDSNCPNPPSFLALADLDRTESNSLWEDDDEYEELAWPGDEPSGLHQLDSEMADATQVSGTEDLEGEPAQWEWKLLSNSPDPASSATAYLDWALTYPESTTPEASDIYLNTVFPTGNGNEGVILKEIQSAPANHLAPVYLVSGIRGFLGGQILHAPSFLPANTAGQGSCKVWTVILNEPNGKNWQFPLSQLHQPV
ncbi:hypothetical protein B0I37DRAFT_112390 [Chaetomium sp. MPI-CAGE-AT-0009]|nr:hypothetical protein B0I37DRAFT_112390 [Chaetomium sp. MPI-CAGE-AT-0009]